MKAKKLNKRQLNETFKVGEIVIFKEYESGIHQIITKIKGNQLNFASCPNEDCFHYQLNYIKVT